MQPNAQSGAGRNPAERIWFGPFEVEFRGGELRKNGRRIRLQHQPFQILQILLESPGEVVFREDIRKRLWPDNTVVEFDHSINAAVKRLRDALRDSADHPRYVETVARRGYRFIGQTHEAEERPGLPEAVVVLSEPVRKNARQDPVPRFALSQAGPRIPSISIPVVWIAIVSIVIFSIAAIALLFWASVEFNRRMAESPAEPGQMVTRLDTFTPWSLDWKEPRERPLGSG